VTFNTNDGGSGGRGLLGVRVFKLLLGKFKEAHAIAGDRQFGFLGRVESEFGCVRWQLFSGMGNCPVDCRPPIDVNSVDITRPTIVCGSRNLRCARLGLGIDFRESEYKQAVSCNTLETKFSESGVFFPAENIARSNRGPHSALVFFLENTPPHIGFASRAVWLDDFDRWIGGSDGVCGGDGNRRIGFGLDRAP